MSIQPGHIPPLQVREAGSCMCADGGNCSSVAPGHALHLIQARLASATPSEWIDGIVTAANSASGRITVRTFDGDPIVLWSAAGAADELRVGDPVALHGLYHVLAVGRSWFNVAR